MSEQSASAEPPHRNQPFSKVGLALSGGGFRATLFHLGVVRFLRDLDLENGRRALELVDCICSVSGGSVLGAFMVLHWDDFLGTGTQFDGRTKELLSFIRSNVRARIFQISLIRLLSPPLLFRRDLSRSNLLRAEYGRLFGDRKLNDLGPKSGASADDKLRGSRPKPGLHILATDMGRGSLISFGADGVNGSPDHAGEGTRIEIAFAIAASSAFPPLFPPLSIGNPEIGLSKDENRFVGTFTDGGVYDNLGIAKFKELHRSQKDPDFIFVSDAGAPFKLQDAKRFKWLVDRTVRTTDILMKRVGDLEQNFPCAVAKLAEPDPGAGSILKGYYPEVARIRTDLDAFNDQEIHALMICGFELAKEAWRKGAASGKLIAGANDPKVPEEWTSVIRSRGEVSPKLKGSDRRRLLRWPWGWPGVIGAALPVVWLAAILVGFQSLKLSSLLSNFGPPSSVGVAEKSSPAADSASPRFVDDPQAAIENLSAYRSTLDPALRIREEFTKDIENGLDRDKSTQASELHYSWIVAPDVVYLLRSYTLSKCDGPFAIPRAISSDDSPLEELAFVDRGGVGFQWLSSGTIDCQNGPRKVLDLVMFSEKVRKGNYLLMYLSKFREVRHFSFDFAIANSELAYPEPSLHSVRELPGITSDPAKVDRLKNIRFYEEDLDSSYGLTNAATDLIGQFAELFRRNLGSMKDRLKEDQRRKTFSFSLEQKVEQIANLRNDSQIYRSFSKPVGNQFNVIVRYYRLPETQ